MNDFKDYTIANLPKDKLEEITKLEAELKSQFGTEVVLVAYQPK